MTVVWLLGQHAALNRQTCGLHPFLIWNSPHFSIMLSKLMAWLHCTVGDAKYRFYLWSEIKDAIFLLQHVLFPHYWVLVIVIYAFCWLFEKLNRTLFYVKNISLSSRVVSNYRSRRTVSLFKNYLSDNFDASLPSFSSSAVIVGKTLWTKW